MTKNNFNFCDANSVSMETQKTIESNGNESDDVATDFAIYH